MPNVFISSEIGSQWRTILGHPIKLIECMGICILSLAHGSEQRVPTLFAYCEKLIWKFFFKFKQGTCPWMAFAWNFFRDFYDFFLGGSVRQIIYREYIVFRGSNISCSLATLVSDLTSVDRAFSPLTTRSLTE